MNLDPRCIISSPPSTIAIIAVAYTQFRNLTIHNWYPN